MQKQFTGFTDVKNWYWAYKDIMNLASLGLADGYDNDEFRPEQPITRGEFAILLYKTLAVATDANIENELHMNVPLLNTSDVAYVFSDLSEHDSIYPYAASLRDYIKPRKERGEKALYAADEFLLRSEILEILIRLLSNEGAINVGGADISESAGAAGAAAADVAVLDGFQDLDEITSQKVKNNAALAVQHGIIVGNIGGTLNMDDSVNRAEACVLLCRMMKVSSWGDAIVFPPSEKYVPDADSGFYDSFFDDAVFVGDSITQGLEIYVLSQRSRGAGLLGSARFLTAVSYSIRAGASDNYLNNKINLSWQGKKYSLEDAMAAMGTKEMYIMLGLNDGVGSNLKYYRDLYEKAMKKVAARNPDILIRIESCTPVTKNRETSSLNNSAYDMFNAMLQDICKASGYDYVDISSGMKREDNSLNPDYTSDKYVHMNSAGSNAWIRSLYEFARRKYIDGEWSSDEDPENYPGIWLEYDVWA